MDRQRRQGGTSTFRIGETLVEEVIACLLGGHGIPSEVGLAAFYHVRAQGLLASERTPTTERVAIALAEPLKVGDRIVRYRFPRVRAKYITAALSHVRTSRPSDDSDIAFRRWLLQIKGVGPKTASWITRNWLGSNRVAIIDIHIYRAGLIAGFFHPEDTVTSNYWALEDRFLKFCDALSEEPAFLDAIIWRQMKECGQFARRLVMQCLQNVSHRG
jgi:thermostable 8-oxoguanine DNA glycosylase